MKANRRFAAIFLLLVGSAHDAKGNAPGEADAAERERATQSSNLEQELQEMRRALKHQQRLLDETRARLNQPAGEPDAAGELVQEIVADEASQGSGDIDVGKYSGSRPLRVYGFLEAGFQKVMPKSTSFIGSVGQSNASTFLVGSINLFFDLQPSEDWRGLLELRFTNAPHGEERSFASSVSDYERVDSTILDSTSPNARNELVAASTVIERAWIQWQAHDELRIRAGSWFTPWGIWNVDHGSPTLISLLLPDFQVTEYFPRSQVGVQASGSLFARPWELGYHAYVSNGRVVGQLDLDESKAFGGRLFLAHPGPDVVSKLGVSAYYGQYADSVRRITSFEPFATERNTTVEAQEWALGGDVSLDINGFRIRTEGAVRRTYYEPGKHAPSAGGPGAVMANRYEWSAYAITAYRLAWGGLEPYLYAEVIHRPSALGDTAIGTSVGMNMYFTPEVQLKLQYAQIRFTDVASERDGSPSDHDMAAFLARLVMVF